MRKPKKRKYKTQSMCDEEFEREWETRLTAEEFKKVMIVKINELFERRDKKEK